MDLQSEVSRRLSAICLLGKGQMNAVVFVWRNLGLPFASVALYLVRHGFVPLSQLFLIPQQPFFQHLPSSHLCH